MKKTFVHLGFLLALGASLALTLHAPHGDVEHVGDDAPHCSLCHSPWVQPEATPFLEAPRFVVSFSQPGSWVFISALDFSLLTAPRPPPVA